MQVKKQQLEPDKEQLTGSKLGKEYDKAVYCYLVYLTSMQSASVKLLQFCPTLSNPMDGSPQGSSVHGISHAFLPGSSQPRDRARVYAEYIMWNARLDESQAGTRLPGEISTTTDMQMIPLK